MDLTTLREAAEAVTWVPSRKACTGASVFM